MLQDCKVGPKEDFKSSLNEIVIDRVQNETHLLDVTDLRAENADLSLGILQLASSVPHKVEITLQDVNFFPDLLQFRAVEQMRCLVEGLVTEHRVTILLAHVQELLEVAVPD